MKKITVIMSLILCLFILASCGGGEDKETTLAPKTTAEETTAAEQTLWEGSQIHDCPVW